MDAQFIAACAHAKQFPPAGLPELAIAGRSNCGKSSLINALVGRKIARTSAHPGRTRQLVFFSARLADGPPFCLVDLPGYGYARVSRQERAAWAATIGEYIERREPLVALLLLADIRRELGDDERSLLRWCRERGLAALVVLTKADKLGRSGRFAAAERARCALGLRRRPELASVKEEPSVIALRRAVVRVLAAHAGAAERSPSRLAPGETPLLVGLTGGVAAGKTLVARCFAELGAPIVDADELAREVVGPGGSALAQIVEQFGSDVLEPSGVLDRARMRRLVFADPAARARLEAITHPAIACAARERFRALAASGQRIVLYDAALLVETGQHEQMDRLITVVADDALRMTRLVERDGVSPAEAARVIAAQLPQQRKAELADYVIDNSGAIAETRARVRGIWDELCAIASRAPVAAQD